MHSPVFRFSLDVSVQAQRCVAVFETVRKWFGSVLDRCGGSTRKSVLLLHLCCFSKFRFSDLSVVNEMVFCVDESGTTAFLPIEFTISSKAVITKS